MTSLKKASGKNLTQNLTPVFLSPWVTLREIFGWFLAGCVVNNLCQKLPLQRFSRYAILIAHDENRVVRDAILVAQETRRDW